MLNMYNMQRGGGMKKALFIAIPVFIVLIVCGLIFLRISGGYYDGMIKNYTLKYKYDRDGKLVTEKKYGKLGKYITRTDHTYYEDGSP